MILHFWLAYDHPFVDGNGRTARALFYWAMLKNGYWIFEYISISNILRESPTKYGRSFLYTETDDNDLTYFLMAQSEVIRKAIDTLNDYIRHKTEEIKKVESHVHAMRHFNHRQTAILTHALKHAGHVYTIQGHKQSHGITYQTARTDLLDMSNKDLLIMEKIGKKFTFKSPLDLSSRLVALNDDSLKTFQ